MVARRASSSRCIRSANRWNEYWLEKIARIGLPATTLSFAENNQPQQISRDISVSDYSSVVDFLLDWLEQRIDFSTLSAVGHRVVHGMHYTESQFISQSVLDELHRISSYDPQHLPAEIALIEKFRQHYPHLPLVAFAQFIIRRKPAA